MIDGMPKPALRAALRARRDAFVSGLGETRAVLEAGLTETARELLERASVVAGYVAIGSEMGCMALLDAAARAGTATALAHVDSRDSPLRFLRWAPGDPLERGYFGLLQPPAGAELLSPDLILTPMLGFDSQLWRIGQGAGFYDRAFAANPAATRLGIAWSVQEVESMPRDAWDEPLDMVCTERKLLHKGLPR
jgi:5-formyltetrahydrofolate cyclo-ligase